VEARTDIEGNYTMWVQVSNRLPLPWQSLRCGRHLSPRERALTEKGIDDSEGLAIQDGAFSDLEAEALVDALGESVGDGSVGGDFAAALCAGPFFGGAEEDGAYATPTV